jgi:predicted RNA-binding protein YlqC (UPF0109 family)
VPDYIALVRFLIEPLLNNPSALSLDCEKNSTGDRLRIRIAFDAADKGRILGRNGRTIQAIRAVITTTAQSASQVVQLDVYDPNPDKSASRDEPHSYSHDRPQRPRSSAPAPIRKRVE